MRRLLIILSITGFIIGCNKIQPNDQFGLEPTTEQISNPGGDPDQFLVKSLIVIIGESNSGGFALNSNLTSYEAGQRVSVKILNNYNYKFETLDIGTNNLLGHLGLTDNATHGLENGLANSVDSDGKNIYILKSGIGGARIYWWNSNTYLYRGGQAWKQCEKRIDTAVKLLTIINNGINPKIYLIWTQGINDAIDNLNPETWKTNTKTFFAKFRTKYGNVPIFMTYLPSNRATYNAKISEIENEVSECYAVQTSDAQMRDGNHWNGEGFKLIATRIVYTLNTHYTY